MDRRSFLVLTGGAAAATALGAWLGPGCARRGGSVPFAPTPGGRPLLVLLVPTDEGEGRRRGEALGAVLNHGGDALLADLAEVDVVCTAAERLPEAVRPASAPLPWLLLVTREGERLAGRSFTPDVLPNLDGMGPRSGEQTLEQMNAEALRGVEALARELHAFLAPLLPTDAGDVGARAATARRRYVASPPPGAHWAHSGGCGTTVEGVRNDGPQVACGMGLVPEAAQRFLHFYVKG